VGGATSPAIASNGYAAGAARSLGNSDYVPGQTGYQPGNTGYQPPGASLYQPPAGPYTPPGSSVPSTTDSSPAAATNPYQPPSGTSSGSPYLPGSTKPYTRRASGASASGASTGSSPSASSGVQAVDYVTPDTRRL